MAGATLLLVDGHAFAYRAFYAIQRLTNSRGEHTNAVFGFAKMVRKLRAERQPDLGAVVMDCGQPTKRLERLPTYKAQRKPMPEELSAQMPWIREFIEASRMPVIEKDGIEADDIIATLAMQAESGKVAVAIATSDKDFMQIVREGIVLLNPAARDAQPVDAAKVRERYGVSPGQIVDLLSLTGDSVDNIPGVPGVGEKTAAALLREFGSVAALYERLEEVSNDKLRQKLSEHRERVELNRDLVRLDTAVALEVHAIALKLAQPDYPRLLALCDRLEFRGLKEEIRRESEKDANLEFKLGA